MVKSRRRDSTPRAARKPTLGPVSARLPDIARLARIGLVVYAALTLTLVLTLHRIPLYGVETDLIGEYIPAARELRAGHPTAAHYGTKGFGYPLLLAAAGAVTGGNDFLGAQLLSVVAAVAGVACTWWFVRALAGELAALLTAALLVLLPTHVRTVFEAGTDQPAFALAMATTCLVLRPGGWRARLFAGFLAGYAVITRYNEAFLLLAAMIAFFRHREPLRGYASYALGAALPIGAWLWTNAALTGSPFTNTNYYNVAFALYGGSRQWSPQVMESFHSLGDVLRFDPARAAATIGRQLVTNLPRDLGQLLPIWLGVACVAGVILRARRLASRPEIVAHWLLSYLTLAWVFYEPRFALYHAPFYLLGAVTFVLAVPVASPRTPRIFARSIMVVALAIATAAASVTTIQERELGAPFEAREAGKFLAPQTPEGGRIMARKPHVAYYAGMTYVPIPSGGSLSELLATGRRERAGWLFFSQMELAARPELAFLGRPDVRIPGLEPVTFRQVDDQRFFALYRLTGDSGSVAELAAPTIEALKQRARDNPNDARALADLAGNLVHYGRGREALPLLERAAALAPNDALMPSLESMARYQIRDYEGAVAAAERADAIRPQSWAILLQLGRSRIQAGRAPQAVDVLRRASSLNPANVDVLVALGMAQLATGDAATAFESFSRALSVAPGVVRLRVDLARMLADAGHVDRALALIEGAPAAERTAGSELAQLAASLRTGP